MNLPADAGRKAIVPATPERIEEAARRLAAGELVAFPTETVYGLGADAANRDAVVRIYRLKGRPTDHPLIVHVGSVTAARRWGHWNDDAERLAQAFWPGPLTMILPLMEGAPGFACGGQTSIGLRSPSHPVAVALLKRFHELGGGGIAAPSANRFGKVSPTRPEHVADDLGVDAPLTLDGGRCEVGVESTIVDLTRAQPVLLRPGRIDRATLERLLGVTVLERDSAAPRASGTLAAHYSPATPVELLDARQLDDRLRSPALASRRLGVWSRVPPESPSAQVAHWQEAPESFEAYEQALYDSLRRMDRLGLDLILIERPMGGAQWEAVIDRLQRAASIGR